MSKDARVLTGDLNQPIGPFYFIPESQFTVFPKASDTEADLRTHYLHDIIVLTVPGMTLTDAQVRRAIASVDFNLPVILTRSLKDQVASNFTQERLIARLTSLFEILSLVLASIGLYGVTAYNVGRRTNEIGVRMALGANRADVFTLVIKDAFALIVTGLVLGLPLSLAAGRFLGSQLYGTNPYDPAVTSLAVGALGFSALVAALIPALRASSISPLSALRAE